MAVQVKFILSKMALGCLLGIAFMGEVQSEIVSKGSVTCYKTVIKEPLTFFGNPGEKFLLYDGSSWKVVSSGPYEYVPIRYRDGLICPEVEILIIGNKVVSVANLKD